MIIGAGYTGLSAALQTSRGGHHTVVLDADDVGWGCSTKNGGQISTSIKPSYEELASKYGAERAFNILKEGHSPLQVTVLGRCKLSALCRQPCEDM